MRTYSDRYHAGKILAEALSAYSKCKNTVILAIPRGGVPVAWEAALFLALPMDVLPIQKLSIPGIEEWTLGAIAENNCISLNESLIHKLGIRKSAIDHIIQTEYRELQRLESLYHEKKTLPVLENKNVIVIDDGICTGSSMNTAIEYLKGKDPASIVIAAPVAKMSVYQALRLVVDEVICLQLPGSLNTVDSWYQDYSSIGEFEVIQLLNSSLV